MSPVYEASTVKMPHTTLFDIPAGSPQLTGFPPSMSDVARGIEEYRADKGYETRTRYDGFDVIERTLPGKEFGAAGQRWRVEAVRVHRIAYPILRESIGETEMTPSLLLPVWAAALSAYPRLGRGPEGPEGKQMKVAADGDATTGFRSTSQTIEATIDTGSSEGYGKDKRSLYGSLYPKELMGTGSGFNVRQWVDVLEVTGGALAFQPNGGYKGVGTGWHPSFNDPANWNPGYSGTSSFALYSSGGGRELSDFLYLTKLQMNNRMWKFLKGNGFRMGSDPRDLVEGAAEFLKRNPATLRSGLLARERHMPTMRRWIEAGMKPWNLTTPADGDVMFASAISAGLFDWAGLTGAINEGFTAGAIGIPQGVHTEYEVASYDKLGEHAKDADLTREDHRFGFSDRERYQMFLTRLFDSQKLGPTLRMGHGTNEFVDIVINAVFRNLPRDEFESFLKRFEIISGSTVPIDMAALAERIEMMRANAHAKGKELLVNNEVVSRAMHALLDEKIQGVRFTDKERGIIFDALERAGFLDVRGQYQFGDLMEGNHDWWALVTALTPNKFTPILGIRSPSEDIRILDTFIVAGSHAVGVVETAVSRVTRGPAYIFPPTPYDIG
jgi:hypothetical protein